MPSSLSVHMYDRYDKVDLRFFLTKAEVSTLSYACTDTEEKWIFYRCHSIFRVRAYDQVDSQLVARDVVSVIEEVADFLRIGWMWSWVLPWPYLDSFKQDINSRTLR